MHFQHTLLTFSYGTSVQLEENVRNEVRRKVCAFNQAFRFACFLLINNGE